MTIVARAIVIFMATVLVLTLWIISPALGTKSETLLKPAAPPPSGEDIPDWQARLELARLLSYTKQYDEAVTNYRAVLTERPNLAHARAELARVLAWSGRNDEALNELGALDEHQLSGGDKLLLADIHALRKDYSRAEPLYRDILRDDPGNQEARLRLAELLSWSGRYPESMELYEAILQALPGDMQVRRKYAQVLSWAGRTQDAIRELRKTLDR